MTDGAKTKPEPKKKRQSPESDRGRQLTFLDELEAFGDRTTFHGLGYVFKQSTFVLRRITWAFIFVASVTACLWQISNAVDQYLRYDTVNSITIKKHESMAFPAVTVCNVNGMRKAYANNLGAPAAHLLQAFLFEGRTSVRAGVDERDSNDQEASEAILAIIADAVNSTFYEFLRDAAPQADRTFLHCANNAAGLDKCLPYVTPVLSLLGMCYTLNPKGRLMPVRQTRDGPETGIALVLNVDTDEYFSPFSRDAVGLRIHLHEPDDFPPVDNGNIVLAPGTDVYMSLQKQVVHNLKKPYSEVN